MTWAYDPHSRTVYTIDATESDDGVIARDVPPEFGALIAAAGEMREALLRSYKILLRERDLTRDGTETATMLDDVLSCARAVFARTEPKP